MYLKEYFGAKASQWDTRILATDISTKVLKQAMAGVYTAEQLQKVPESWKKKFFGPIAGGSQYKVKDELKAEVIFRQFNLMDPFPFRKKMHVVQSFLQTHMSHVST